MTTQNRFEATPHKISCDFQTEDKFYLLFEQGDRTFESPIVRKCTNMKSHMRRILRYTRKLPKMSAVLPD